MIQGSSRFVWKFVPTPVEPSGDEVIHKTKYSFAPIFISSYYNNEIRKDYGMHPKEVIPDISKKISRIEYF